MRLLTICPSYMRPGHVEEMLKTFDATKSPGTEIFVYLSHYDPFLKQYRKILRGRNFYEGERVYMTNALNETCFDRYPEIPYYQILCDDFRYRTVGWDEKLINALHTRANDWGWACGRDLINNDNWHKYEHPSAEVFSWKFIKTMGYVWPRGFKQFGMDKFSKYISMMLPNGTIHVPEVVIEHLLWEKPEQMDETSKISYSPEMVANGKEVLRAWMENESEEVISRLHKAIKKESP
jgi:hypothetical protein